MGLILLTHILATLTGVVGSLVLLEFSKNKPNITVINYEPQKTTYDIISDILRNMIPTNIIQASTSQEITKYVKYANETYVKEIQLINGTNVLGLLVFSLLLGFAASSLGKKAEKFKQFFESTNDVIITSKMLLYYIILNK